MTWFWRSPARWNAPVRKEPAMSDPVRLLRAVRFAPEAEPEEHDAQPTPPPPEQPDAGAGQAGGPVATLSGGQVTLLDQAGAAISHALRSARLRIGEMSEQDGGMIHGIVHGQPPSLKDQTRYLRGRGWVPPGHDGGWSERLGVLYHLLIGVPGVAAGNAFSALCARPLRLLSALLLLLLIVIIAAVWL
jgi:hypothetical protein